MIEWLRNRFKSSIVILFVLIVLAFTVIGGVIGYKYASDYIGEFGGGFSGSCLGLILGLTIAIGVCGFYATIVNISLSTDTILDLLVNYVNESNNQQNDLNCTAKNINTQKD